MRPKCEVGYAEQRYAEQRNAEIIARFTEIERATSPTGRNWPRHCVWRGLPGATVVIAKLEQLSRNAAFLVALRDSGVGFSAVDLPDANDLIVGIMALVAQQEREAISRRTKEALAVARATPSGMRGIWRRWSRTFGRAVRPAFARSRPS